LRSQRPQGSVRLCVGGARYEADAADLCGSSAWFCALLSGTFPVPRDDAGAFFIDRDWAHFALILDYLQFGIASLHNHLGSLGHQERAALLEEAAFYRLPELAGAAAEPPVGSAAVVRLPSQELAARGIQEPLHHDACSKWHAPGACSDLPVGCTLLGTATLTCIVRDYKHRVCSRIGTNLDHPSHPAGDCRAALEIGIRPEMPGGPGIPGEASEPAGQEQVVASRWTLEYRGHFLEATEGQFVQV